MRRATPQRRAILRALRQAAGPLTPQEILERAGREQPGLGMATVYRNLGVLEEQREVQSVYLPGDVARYEPFGRGHHHHFRCSNCEGVYELTTYCPVGALEGATLPGGFHVSGHELTLYGVCPDCSQVRRGTA